MLAGSASEKKAILRMGARMYAAQTSATVPKLEVTMRKAYGFGSMVMGMIPFDGQSAVFGFPGATMGAMGASAMSRARGSDEEEAGMLRQAEVQASYRSAHGFGFDELIDPRDPQRAAPFARTRAVPPPSAGRASRPHRHHAVVGVREVDPGIPAAVTSCSWLW